MSDAADKRSMVDIAYYKRINSEFYRRIGVINCVERLNKMGLEPQNIIGTFWARDIPSLLEVCVNDPQLHIITTIHAGQTVNKYIKGPYKYRLADGDSDPRLELNLPPEAINHILAELNQFIRRAGMGF